jgi:hypothetical protein
VRGSRKSTRVTLMERVGEAGKVHMKVARRVRAKYTGLPHKNSNIPDFPTRIQFVGLSHSWQELAHRCGARVKRNGKICNRIVTVLKQKVLFLKLDIQHFTYTHTKRLHPHPHEKISF